MTKNTVKKIDNGELLRTLIRNHAYIVKYNDAGHRINKRVLNEYDICLREICNRLSVEYDESQFYF